MAGSGSVKLPNKEPDCSVNVLLPVGVRNGAEWPVPEENPTSERSQTGRGFHLASQLARQSASQLLRPLMDELDFTKAVRVT